MYVSLFDEGHRLNKLSPVNFIKGNKHVSRPPSGEYEGSLLCAQCDNEIIGSYETYARKALYGDPNGNTDLPECANFKTTGGIGFTHCKNIHYKEFKLFLLSILWRASISSRPFFREVSLCPYEEEIIRQMILNGDPKDAETFPILIITWLNDKSASNDVVAQPGVNRQDKGIRYIFPIAGVTYIFHMSPISLDQNLKGFILSAKNEAFLLHIPAGHSTGLLLTYFGAKV